MNIEPGSKIGDYEVLAPLGAGGMGRVYKVRNELSDRLEAMKVLLPDLQGQADLANRFLREIKVQAGLDHPNIAKLYTALRVENQLVMLMELVEGATLDERLKQGPLPIREAVDYISQVLAALDYAHQRGVVHRDIKPANMMLLPNGRIKLLDFGIAKAAVDQRLTVTGTTLGSLYYMSPEQIQGSGVDFRSDLYSVGVSLYEMVTGKKPFDGESQFAIMSAHLARSPVPPIEVNASLPPVISEIILMSLSKDPASRFQTARALLNALSNVQVGAAPIPAAALSPAPQPASPPPARAVPTAPTLTVASPLPSQAPPTAPTVTAVPAAPPLGASVASVTAVPAPALPAAAPPQDFHLIEPTGVAVKKSGPRRLIWLAVGSLCAAGAIVAFIQFGPYRQTSAKETRPAPVTAVTPAATPPQQSLTAPPVTPPPEPAASAPPASAPEHKPVASGETKKKQPPERAQVEPPPAAGPPPRRSPAEGLPPQRSSAEPQQPESMPRSQLDTQLPAAVNKNRMEVQGLSEQLDMLVVRANTLRVTLSNLQRSQEAQGVGLRADWVEALNMVNNFLRKANQAIDNSDAVAARDNMGKAAVKIEFLEKALGR
jgi:eukaryotic-like serine/threonine-protein kinase